MFNLDTLLNPGQKVKVRRTVVYTYEVDITEYYGTDTNDEPMSVEEFNTDMEENFTISDIENEMGEVLVETDIVEVYAISNKKEETSISVWNGATIIE